MSGEAVAATATEPVVLAGPAEARRERISRTVAGLTVINVLGSATGFITGPLLARALGASGRGDLAAVVVPLTLAPSIIGLGIPGYAYRTLPQGKDVGEVMGSLALPLFVLGLAAAAAGVPLADLLAGGRHAVRAYLIVVFVSMPVLLVGGLLLSSLSALRRWPSVMATNLLPFTIALLGIATMYVVGDLTVATAAAVTIAGSVVAIGPGLPLLVRSRLRFRPSLAREGLSFGAKSWIGGLAATANGRLDQLLMITMVAPRVLGLYAVATTLAGASGLIGGALSPPLMARVASGESKLMAQAVRIMISTALVIGAVLAVLTPVLLSVLFGPQFRTAYGMALILLMAQVPLTGASVLSSALQADGAPLIPTVAEGLALIITVAGLVTLLRPLGGVGAALVSLAAYSTSFSFQVVMARRRIGVPIREFLVPTRADSRWAWGRFTTAAGLVRFS
jgi:O-antigen/teichoic acid export membrane protein